MFTWGLWVTLNKCGGTEWRAALDLGIYVRRLGLEGGDCKPSLLFAFNEEGLDILRRVVVAVADPLPPLDGQ